MCEEHFREIIIDATITGTLMILIMSLPVGLVVVLEVVGFNPGSGIFRHGVCMFSPGLASSRSHTVSSQFL